MCPGPPCAQAQEDPYHCMSPGSSWGPSGCPKGSWFRRALCPTCIHACASCSQLCFLWDTLSEVCSRASCAPISRCCNTMGPLSAARAGGYSAGAHHHLPCMPIPAATVAIRCIACTVLAGRNLGQVAVGRSLCAAGHSLPSLSASCSQLCLLGLPA